MTFWVRIPVMVAGLVALSGCGAAAPTTIVNEGSETTLALGINGNGGITPMCQLGCIPPQDEDPSPGSPGEWIGEAFSGGYCFGDEGNDLDLDGIVDQCEWKLAETFAPQMMSEASDDVGGEPYYGVQRVAGEANTIIIVYLLSYYEDLGCWNFGGCAIVEDSHSGDSEAVGVYARFDANSQHWVVDQVIMSQHEDTKIYHRGSNAYPIGLEYLGRAGGKFKVHVSGGKHANYATVSECQSGGSYGSDHCSPGQIGWTLDTPNGRNVGSDAVKFKNCVFSADRYVLSGEQECHWTGSTFTGWQGPTVNAKPGNRERLRFFKFLPCTAAYPTCAIRG